MDKDVVLSWITACSSNLRHYTSEAELCQARDLQTCLPFVFSFSSFISSSTAIRYQSRWSKVYSYISAFCVSMTRKAGYANQVQFIVFLTKVIRGGYGYGWIDG